MRYLYSVEFGETKLSNLARIETSVVTIASSPDSAAAYAQKLYSTEVQRVVELKHVVVDWPSGEVYAIEKQNTADLSFRLDVILRREERRRASIRRASNAFFGCGKVASRLRVMSDKQIAQLANDHLGERFAFGTPQTLVLNEAVQRLFRSQAGGRDESEFFNEPTTLQTCSKCNSPMLRVVGIGQPDYWHCVSLKCGHKEKE